MTTFFYAAIFAFFLIFLAVSTIKARARNKVAFGIGDSHDLQKWIRAHGNFVEYVPFTFLLIFFLEISDVNQILIHFLFLFLLIGRISHVYGLTKSEQYIDGRMTKFPKYRVFGMVLTFFVIFVSALLLLEVYFRVIFS